jgi:hypothetical protein
MFTFLHQIIKKENEKTKRNEVLLQQHKLGGLSAFYLFIYLFFKIW